MQRTSKGSLLSGEQICFALGVSWLNAVLPNKTRQYLKSPWVSQHSPETEHRQTRHNKLWSFSARRTPRTSSAAKPSSEPTLHNQLVRSVVSFGGSKQSRGIAKLSSGTTTVLLCIMRLVRLISSNGPFQLIVGHRAKHSSRCGMDTTEQALSTQKLYTQQLHIIKLPSKASRV